eukprot:TRINITY_DN6886_c0_g1_i2.p1 TRINITY_DN6886_c0_g1~~TRINITY_DN6886_c0_g1_i2.p1  ORF type:complete len:274 (-),score=32.08 TRINITY_DN6886_c0_g1_i2:130-951(-)
MGMFGIDTDYIIEELNNFYFLFFIFVLVMVFIALLLRQTRRHLAAFLKSCGVGIRRVPRVIKELKRKGFHFSGLLIPGIYLFGLSYQILTHRIASIIMGTLMFICICAEVGRFKIPAFKRFMNENLTAFMREEEKEKYSAILSYCVGVTFSIIVFSPLVAVAAILYLVVGDFAAALVGISYGRIKIGKKSLEGSIACFISCFIIGSFILWRLDLCEQLAFWGALAATLTELLNPNMVDDNLSIPVISGFAIQLIASRLGITIPQELVPDARTT